MGKIIHTDSPSTRREKIMRLLAFMVNQMDFSHTESQQFLDQVAFSYLSLREIQKTIDDTVSPWEKRDYWLKADQFRLNWAWVKILISRIEKKRNQNGWNNISEELRELHNKMEGVEPVKKLDQKEFWQGAYEILKKIN